MNRRDFLKISASTALYNLLPFKLSFADTLMPTVWEAEGSPADTIKALFSALGGIENFIFKELTKATVLIKPNICLPHQAEMGTTTSPAVVEALCDYLLNNGLRRIIITDHTLQKTSNFKNIELMKLEEKYKGVKLSLANQQRQFHPVQVNGKVLKRTEVLKMLSRADMLINLPTAKHHSATNVSLAIKNLMGLIWDRAEFHTRLDLSQAIADLAQNIRPSLNIVDASRVLLNGGPTGPGPVIEENRLFAGLDILALDAVVTSRYNFGGKSLTAKEVPHLWAAYQNGLGEADTSKIHIEKLDIKSP